MLNALSVEQQYGVNYYAIGEREVITASPADLYFYTVYIGQHKLNVEQGDCAYYLSENVAVANAVRGPVEVTTSHLAVVIRGYMPDSKTSALLVSTHLPYINGCSTKQIFPPERLGDPTMQMLMIPPHTSEQAHHIHSTVRVVYVLQGSGRSIVGTRHHFESTELKPGMTIILNKMCPHHFETESQALVVLPIHIFSSVGKGEFNHPMHNGTYLVER